MKLPLIHNYRIIGQIDVSPFWEPALRAGCLRLVEDPEIFKGPIDFAMGNYVVRIVELRPIMDGREIAAVVLVSGNPHRLTKANVVLYPDIMRPGDLGLDTEERDA